MSFISKLLGREAPYKALKVTNEEMSFVGPPEGSAVGILVGMFAGTLGKVQGIRCAYLERVKHAREEHTRLALVLSVEIGFESVAASVATACRAAHCPPFDILLLEALASDQQAKVVSKLPIYPVSPLSETDRLWRMQVKVGRGTNLEMPTEMSEAYVHAFVGARDHEAAAVAMVAELKRRGLTFLDIPDKKIDQIDPMKWDAYLRESWSDFPDQFPTQLELTAGLRFGPIFFGPFAGYGT